MKPEEAAWWLKSERENSVSCISCGDRVHRDYALQNIDDEWACEPCSRWLGTGG